jgi:hypothetical protein
MNHGNERETLWLIQIDGYQRRLSLVRHTVGPFTDCMLRRKTADTIASCVDMYQPGCELPYATKTDPEKITIVY